MTSKTLALELEVTPRTILRDVDALTEAGLPIIVFQGNQGGIELGFGYRTRLTGLAADEAEALAVILHQHMPEIADLGIEKSANRARSKLIESLPDGVRENILQAGQRFKICKDLPEAPDIRIAALAKAIRNASIVHINTRTRDPQEIFPIALIATSQGWKIKDQKSNSVIPLQNCGDLNISAQSFLHTIP